MRAELIPDLGLETEDLMKGVHVFGHRGSYGHHVVVGAIEFRVRCLPGHDPWVVSQLITDLFPFSIQFSRCLNPLRVSATHRIDRFSVGPIYFAHYRRYRDFSVIIAFICDMLSLKPKVTDNPCS